MLRQSRTLHHHSQPLISFTHHIGIHKIVYHSCCLRAFPRREDEGVCAVELGFGCYFQCALKVFFGFAGEAHDDVGGHCQIVYRFAGSRQLRQVSLGGIPPMHRSQNSIAARLQREMQMLANLWHFSHHRKSLRAHVFRMRASEPHSPDAFHLADRPQQIAEERAHPHRLALPPPS